VTVVDQDGFETKLPASGPAEVSKGDNVVMLIQRLGRGGSVSRATGLFNANDVDRRLERLASTAADPLKTARIKLLRSGRDEVEERRLQKTADRSSGGLQSLIGDKVRKLRDKRSHTTDDSKALLTCAQRVLGENSWSYGDLSTGQQARLKKECLADNDAPRVKIIAPAAGANVAAGASITITAEAEDNVGVVSVAFTVDGTLRITVTEAPYSATLAVPFGAGGSSIKIGAEAVDETGNRATDAVSVQVVQDPPPTVKITSPVVGPGSREGGGDNGQEGAPSSLTLIEGQTITISADASDNGSVVSVAFGVDGQTLATVTTPPYSVGYTVPNTPSAAAPQPIVIVATATDDTGNITSDTVIVGVKRGGAPSVRIVIPSLGASVVEGETLVITVETDDDSRIAAMLFSVGGQVTTLTGPPFTHRYLVPSSGTIATTPSGALPHVFVGTATLNGSPAPDGTIVVAYVAAPRLVI